MSGEGRDFFIYKGIQTEHDRISDNDSFEKSLRKGDSPVEYFMSTKRPRNKFEKKLINRIFYGKCPGLKDRQMSPKVKFKKDIEKEKEEKEKDEENKFSNNISLRNSFFNNKVNENNTKTNNINNLNTKYNNKINILFTPIHNRKKKLNIKINNDNQNDNLIDSVKKIFLYNRKNKIGNEEF